MIRASVIAAALALAGVAAPARAQSPGSDQIDVAAQLEAAQSALAAADHARAADLAATILQRQVSRADLAEAWRVRGLALFFLGKRAQAEQALFEFLKLDVDANLDPALVPPDAIAFFQGVRLDHEVELRAYRPKPPRRLHWWWNVVPVAGQIQNGDTTKAWIIGSAEVALLAVNVATYAVLKTWCNDGDGSCEPDGSDRNDTARSLQVVNAAAGIVLIGVGVYGMVDGFVGYRRLVREESQPAAEPTRLPVSVGVVPSQDGVVLSIGTRF